MIGGVLLVIARMIFPHLVLDTTNLLILGVCALLFLLPDIAPYINNIKVGNAEVTFKDIVNRVSQKATPQVADNLLEKVNKNPKDQKEIVQKQLDEMFLAGVKMSEDFKQKSSSHRDSLKQIKLNKRSDGIIALSWDDKS